MKWLLVALTLLPGMITAEPLRIASFNTELSRDGPGQLLRDLQKGKDKQIADVLAVIARTSPDILAMQGVDWDHDGLTLDALARALADAGTPYPHRLALKPNSGIMTDLDLDGDGRLGGPGDAQGYGKFTGQNGMVILSRYPIDHGRVQDFSALLWKDLPGARLPQRDGAPFPSQAAQDIQRLSSAGHWVVSIKTPVGRIHLLTSQAGPPVFDGPEDRNGLRNRDENRFWSLFLDGTLGPAPPHGLVLLGGTNLDPWDSDGYGGVVQGLLDDPRLQDPAPTSDGAATAPDQGHRSPNATDTVDWDGVGRLRVDYVLPSRDWTVQGSGVYWPAEGEAGNEIALGASRHRLVWVDLIAKE
ncbi:endonuclease/exonuclease/phosphatase family protein [Tropicibacter sp. Alg240-R139]|uniref:endonuclease/exonuclease/phosphatase family protein n=1 Tax=Tropicibacter sp. Alg240-R139 TaxID=2305991 RepID=UPI0013DFEDB0|nr:endonuclease/exonuclease/phosphatase family protein [Tropicibacter sp. Alg240-R139]